MAKRQPGSRRRQEPTHADDAFVAKVFELSTWARGNSQVLILFGVVLVLIVVGSWYYVNYRQRMTLMAVEELEAIHQVVGSGEAETARVRLAQYIERFDGTHLAGEARVLLGRLHLESGDPGQAVEVLDDADVAISEPLGPQIAILLARAHEARGELDDAESVYLNVADRADLEFQVVQALEDAARLRMQQGNPAGAAELYERLLDRMEDTDPERGRIEMRLSEARVAAARNG